MSHDMSIHVHEVGTELTGQEMADYLAAWDCTPLQPIHAPGVFICVKEVNGYQEVWKATKSKPSGEVELIRRQS